MIFDLFFLRISLKWKKKRIHTTVTVSVSFDSVKKMISIATLTVAKKLEHAIRCSKLTMAKITRENDFIRIKRLIYI